MNEKLIVLIFNILKSKVGLSLAKSGLESFVNHVQLHINLKKKHKRLLQILEKLSLDWKYLSAKPLPENKIWEIIIDIRVRN